MAFRNDDRRGMLVGDKIKRLTLFLFAHRLNIRDFLIPQYHQAPRLRMVKITCQFQTGSSGIRDLNLAIQTRIRSANLFKVEIGLKTAHRHKLLFFHLTSLQ